MAEEEDRRKARKKYENNNPWEQGTVFMSNNINPFTVMPLSPNQVQGIGNNPNLTADTITAFTPGNTIEVYSSININPPALLEYDGQSILPNQLSTSNVQVIVSNIANVPTFEVVIDGVPQLTLTNGEAVFGYSTPNDYNLVVDGFLSTSNSVGIKQPADPNYSLSISGDVLINGNVNLGGVSVINLGIGTSVSPGNTLEVSGNTLLKGTLTTTKNAYFQSLVGIGKFNPAVALDVSGAVHISSNLNVDKSIYTNTLYANNIILGPTGGSANNQLDVSGSVNISSNLFVGRNTFTSNLAIGKTGISPGIALDVSGAANISSNLNVAKVFSSSNVVIGTTGPTGLGCSH